MLFLKKHSKPVLNRAGKLPSRLTLCRDGLFHGAPVFGNLIAHLHWPLFLFLLGSRRWALKIAVVP